MFFEIISSINNIIHCINYYRYILFKLVEIKPIFNITSYSLRRGILNQIKATKETAGDERKG